MAVYNGDGIFARDIHSLENSYFRVKFEDDLYKYTGNIGIGVISDTDAQPIVVNSHLGRFAMSARSATSTHWRKKCSPRTRISPN